MTNTMYRINYIAMETLWWLYIYITSCGISIQNGPYQVHNCKLMQRLQQNNNNKHKVHPWTRKQYKTY